MGATRILLAAALAALFATQTGMAATSADPRDAARAAQLQICAKVMQLRTSYAAAQAARTKARTKLADAQKTGDAAAIRTAQSEVSSASTMAESIGRMLCAAEMSYEANLKQSHTAYCNIGGRTC